MAVLNKNFFLDRNKKFSRINKLVGKAVVKYDLINDKDRVLVAVSGGKDSMALLACLNDRKEWVPIDFEIVPVHIDPGFEDGCAKGIKDFLTNNDIDVHVEYTNFGVMAHGPENIKKSPCFICSLNLPRSLDAIK
jgi:tRNA 2-thiocytidine biosynthesis protein TtcA